MADSIIQSVGIGLRAPHIEAFLGAHEVPAWVEVHSENWMSESKVLERRLDDIRQRAEVSLHGVGLSLGSHDALDAFHLRQLKALAGRVRPVLISEHLCWSAIDGEHSNDLLPLAMNAASISLLAERIDHVQQVLGQALLVENVSSYCTFMESTMPEWEFVNEVVTRANCRLLLDINNIYVNASNHRFAADDYLRNIAWDRVDELHLAGHEDWDGVLIDTHSRPVSDAVWQLFNQAVPYLNTGTRVLLEWDSDLPSFSLLLDEAAKASAVLARNAAGKVQHG